MSLHPVQQELKVGDYVVLDTNEIGVLMSIGEDWLKDGNVYYVVRVLTREGLMQEVNMFLKHIVGEISIAKLRETYETHST